MANKKKEAAVVEVSSALQKAMDSIRSKYGEGSVMGEGSVAPNVEFMTTGSILLDEVMGGGVPKGRIVETSGLSSSGKSTTCYFIMAQVQKAGGVCLLIDAENSFDAKYGKSVGLDVNKLIITQPGTLEEAFDIMKEFIESGSVSLIVVDSVASLTPKSFIEGDDMLKTDIGTQAKLMSKGLMILNPLTAKHNTSIIFINQIRENPLAWGNKETTPGGKALGFYASVRLKVNKGEKIMNKTDHVGNRLRVTATKNKVAMPFKECEIDLYFGKGIDLVADVFHAGVLKEVIVKDGTSYMFDGERIAVGLDASIRALSADAKLCDKIRNALYEKNKIK